MYVSIVNLIENSRNMKEENMMPIKVLSGLRKLRQEENNHVMERAHKQIHEIENKLAIDEARKHVIQTLGEANEVRYFYTLNNEDEQHIAYIMLDKAITKAIGLNRNDYNELNENRNQLNKSIEQVNLYLSRRYLQTKTQHASELIQLLSNDQSSIEHFLVDVQLELNQANECLANYLSTSSEIRNAFNQLNNVLNKLEINLQPS